MPEEEKPPGLHPQVDIFDDRGAAPLELDAGTGGLSGFSATPLTGRRTLLETCSVPLFCVPHR